MRRRGRLCLQSVCKKGSSGLFHQKVLMTALSAGIALIPLLLAAHEPGKEILHPVAVVIVGGLVSSTFLDLAVTPAVFWLFGRRAAEKALRLDAPAAQ